MALYSCHCSGTSRSRTGSSETAEVLRVGGSEVLQPELRVLHRRERRCLRQPPQLPSGGQIAKQVEENLCPRLPRADDGHVAGTRKLGLTVQVLTGVEDAAADDRGECFRNYRLCSDAEDDVLRPDPLGAVRGDELDLVRAVPAHRGDARAERARRQPLAHPPAVVVVLAPQHVHALGEVEREHPVVRPQVVEERPLAGRVDEGDQVGEDRDLQHCVVEQQPRMPRPLPFALQEAGGQAVDRIGQGGE